MKRQCKWFRRLLPRKPRKRVEGRAAGKSRTLRLEALAPRRMFAIDLFGGLDNSLLESNDDFPVEAVTVGDFNGDGYDDTAFGMPEGDIGSLLDLKSSYIPAAGSVRVVYGGPQGVTEQGTQSIYQGMLRGSESQTGSRFGAALSAGDFNGDGIQDLAIAAPRYDTSALEDVGRVEIIFGSVEGLRPAFHITLADGEIDGLRAGYALASGDLNRDGADDLAVGAPGGAETDYGAVLVYHGTGNGLLLSLPDSRWGLMGDKLDKEGGEEIGGINWFEPVEVPGGGEGPFFTGVGSALAVGDFDRDGYDDLAIGAPTAEGDSGAVSVIYGSYAGLSTANKEPKRLMQSFESNTYVYGLHGRKEQGDLFGASLAAGDFDADGYDDLAIGAPGEGIRVRTKQTATVEGNIDTFEAGAVNVVFGSSGGILIAGNQVWHQDNFDGEHAAHETGDIAETGDRFGHALATGDFNGDGRVDLAIGVPYEDFDQRTDTGIVQVLIGSADRGLITYPRGQLWVSSQLADHERFGLALAAGNIDNDNYSDLVVGAGVAPELAESDSVDSTAHVLLGTANGRGLGMGGTQVWRESTRELDQLLAHNYSSPLASSGLDSGIATFANNKGVVYVFGTEHHDDVNVWRDHAPSRIQVSLLAKDNSDNVLHAWARAFDLSIHDVVFNAFGGDDWFNNRTDVDSTAAGGDGDDRLFGGSGDDVLDGGNGQDWLYGRGGDDTLDGGDDGIQDFLDGGPGSDTFSQYSTVRRSVSWFGSIREEKEDEDVLVDFDSSEGDSVIEKEYFDGWTSRSM